MPGVVEGQVPTVCTGPKVTGHDIRGIREVIFVLQQSSALFIHLFTCICQSSNAIVCSE